MPRGKRAAQGNGRRRGRPAQNRGASPALATLQTYRQELIAQQTQLATQIQAVDQALAAMGGAAGVRFSTTVGGARRGRPAGGGPRPGSLKSYITEVLGRGQEMAVKDITSAVMQAGYATRNKTLAKSVGIALTEMSNVQKMGRGRFRLK